MSMKLQPCEFRRLAAIAGASALASHFVGEPASAVVLLDFGVGGPHGTAIQACSRLMGYLEGGFGTLVASAAGIGAIVAAAVGGFKAAWALVVVSVGCFILRSFLYLFLTGC